MVIEQAGDAGSAPDRAHPILVPAWVVVVFGALTVLAGLTYFARRISRSRGRGAPRGRASRHG